MKDKKVIKKRLINLTLSDGATATTETNHTFNKWSTAINIKNFHEM